MIYGILILICIFALCGIGVWFAYRFYKKKIEKAELERIIQEDILEEFNYAENKMKGGLKEDGTTTSPYQILWNIAKNRRTETIRDASRTEQTASSGELYPEFDGGQNIQSGIITKPNENQQHTRKSKSDNLRSVISRIRRRTSTI